MQKKKTKKIQVLPNLPFPRVKLKAEVYCRIDHTGQGLEGSFVFDRSLCFGFPQFHSEQEWRRPREQSHRLWN